MKIISDNRHLISNKANVLDALKQINTIAPDPLVLFVLDRENRMIGTISDGDVRRALIVGGSVKDSIEKVMHRDFNFLRRGIDDDVQHLRWRNI